MHHETVTVERFYTEQAAALELTLLAGASGLKRAIREPTVNRPGLVLSGFTRYFAYKRVQVVGNAEAFFLKSLPQAERIERYKTFFSYKLPCVVFSRHLHPDRLLTLLVFYVLPVSLRARYILLFLAILAVFGILFHAGNMAHAAHLGGMFTGMAYVHLREGSWRFPKPRWLSRRPPLRRPGARLSRSRFEDSSPDENLDSEVDAILDKISASGIHSLTDRERRVLEQARQRMVNR